MGALGHVHGNVLGSMSASFGLSKGFMQIKLCPHTTQAGPDSYKHSDQVWGNATGATSSS